MLEQTKGEAKLQTTVQTQCSPSQQDGSDNDS